MSILRDLRKLGNTDFSRFCAKAPDGELSFFEYLAPSHIRSQSDILCVRRDLPGGEKEIRYFVSSGDFLPEGGKPRSRPLYNLSKLNNRQSTQPSGGKERSRVIVVEGEKCVEPAERVFPNDVVVTWAGGSKATDYTDWKPLETDDVTLVADADANGRNAMKRIARRLKGYDCLVHLYLPPGDSGEDIHDWAKGLEAGSKGIAKLAGLIEAGPEESDPSAGKSLQFADPEPWPEEVDGEALLERLSALVGEHMHMSGAQAYVVALWIIMSWIHHHPNIDVAPFLNITAPTKRAGKTTLLGIAKELARKPHTLVSASPAYLFRIIELHEPTILLDEIDLKSLDQANGGNGELTGMINGSQTRDTAKVGRVEQRSIDKKTVQVPVDFATWCPKVLCGIGGLADTTVDRSIQIHLERKPASKKLPRWRDRDRKLIEGLLQQIFRWSKDNADLIVRSRYKLRTAFPESMNDREVDSWELLWAVASVAGGECLKKAQDASKEILSSTGDNLSNPELLIRDVRRAFEEKGDPKFLSTADILECLNWNKESPWGDWNRGSGISPHRLGKMLEPFGLGPGRGKNAKGERVRGFLLADIDCVSARYASHPPFKASQASQGPEHPADTDI